MWNLDLTGENIYRYTVITQDGKIHQFDSEEYVPPSNDPVQNVSLNIIQTLFRYWINGPVKAIKNGYFSSNNCFGYPVGYRTKQMFYPHCKIISIEKIVEDGNKLFEDEQGEY